METQSELEARNEHEEVISPPPTNSPEINHDSRKTLASPLLPGFHISSQPLSPETELANQLSQVSLAGKQVPRPPTVAPSSTAAATSPPPPQHNKRQQGSAFDAAPTTAAALSSPPAAPKGRTAVHFSSPGITPRPVKHASNYRKETPYAMRALKQEHERARALTDGAAADTKVHFMPRPAAQPDAAAAVRPAAQHAQAGVIAPLSELAQAVCVASQAAAPATLVRPPTLVMFVPDCLEVSRFNCTTAQALLFIHRSRPELARLPAAPPCNSCDWISYASPHTAFSAAMCLFHLSIFLILLYTCLLCTAAAHALCDK
jgi:hypothetical protein